MWASCMHTFVYAQIWESNWSVFFPLLHWFLSRHLYSTFQPVSWSIKEFVIEYNIESHSNVFYLKVNLTNPMCLEHMKLFWNLPRSSFDRGVGMHQRKALPTGTQWAVCRYRHNHCKRMLGRTHQPCREHHNNKIVLEEMSFEMGKQSKEFVSSKGTRRIRYGWS